MNLPNKLTMLRIILIPFFVFFLLCFNVPNNFLWALILFAVASITDTLDGRIARKNNLVTDFGKLMDPLADKLLVTSALIGFAGIGAIPAYVVIIIVAREFLVTSIRLLAAEKGRVIAADMTGKIKTTFQMTWLCYLMFYYQLATTGIASGPVWPTFHQILMWITVGLTVYSGGHYVLGNLDLLADR